MSNLMTREGWAKIDRASVEAEFFGSSGQKLGSTYLEARERAVEFGDVIDYAHVVMKTLDGAVLARQAKWGENEADLVAMFKRLGHEDGDCVVL